MIYTAANDELLSPQEREDILAKIQEMHGKEVISGMFDYDSPTFSQSDYQPILAKTEDEDAISQESVDVEDEEYEEE